jgi:hypothetical protein
MIIMPGFVKGGNMMKKAGNITMYVTVVEKNHYSYQKRKESVN